MKLHFYLLALETQMNNKYIICLEMIKDVFSYYLSLCNIFYKYCVCMSRFDIIIDDNLKPWLVEVS